MKALRLYCALYASGAVKIGISTSVLQRLRALRRRGRIVRSYVGRDVVAGMAAEKAALASAGRIAQSTLDREFFHGLSFGEACTIIDQATARWRVAVSPKSINLKGLRMHSVAGVIRVRGPGVAGILPAAQLERWLIRQMRAELLPVHLAPETVPGALDEKAA